MEIGRDRALELMEEHGKEGWFEKQNSAVLHTYSALEGIFLRDAEDFGIHFEVGVILSEGFDFHWHWSNSEMVSVRKALIERTEDDPNFIEKAIGAWKPHWETLRRSFEEIDAHDLDSAPDSAIKEMHASLVRNYYLHEHLPYIADSFLSVGKSYWLNELIVRELKGKASAPEMDKIAAELTAPSFHSFLAEEQLGLMEIGAGIERAGSKAVLAKKWEDAERELGEKNPEILALLARHAKKFHWIRNNYKRAVSADSRVFFEELASRRNEDFLRSLEAAKERPNLASGRRRELVERFGLSKRLQNVLELASKIAWWHDLRKKAVLMTNHYLFQLIDQASKRTGTGSDLLAFTPVWEFGEALDGNADLQRLADRKKAVVLVFSPEGHLLLEGEEAMRFGKPKFAPVEQNNEVEGLPACNGFATGRAVVLKHASNMSEVRQGDVIIASMTTPEYVPVMRKASAIVTDQGGLTCHAAIVSRELGIPCVVGTGNATRAFKTGDTVQVDANNGTVRKL